MTGRDDLDELRALAASIADETHGWRAHRKARASAATGRRLEREMSAPLRRRRRHRWMAGVAIAMVVIAAAVLVIIHKPATAAAARPPAPVVAPDVPSQVRAGQAAARSLHALDREANVFSCQGWYDSQHLAQVPSQATAAWRGGYLKACAEGG